MSENCSNDCGSCSEECSERQMSKEDFLEPANPYSKVKKVIGIVSGKGGVGKSLVTSYLSVLFNRKGYKTAILDADVTGPSIPKTFGLHEKAKANERGIIPEITKNGTKVMSVNLLLDDEDTPVLWRGPIVAGTVKQFWSQVIWGDVDYMFVDMPPGTGDVPLTVFQSIPLDGIVIVTSPQELVSMIVSKAVNMAKEMEVPILGIVENYSYIKCKTCGEKINVFGESHVKETAEKYGLNVLGNIPIDQKIAQAVDKESIEELEGEWLDKAVERIEEIMSENVGEIKTTKIAIATSEDNTIFGHFGKCPEFTIFEIERQRVVNKTSLKSNGSGHSELGELLKSEEVDTLICGGIGEGAMDILSDAGIKVIPGIEGDVDQALVLYLAGNCTPSATANCDHHHEEGHSCCGECKCH